MSGSFNGELVKTLGVPEFYRMLFGDIVMVYAHSKERPDLCFVLKTADDSRGGKTIESAIKRYSYLREECSRLGRASVQPDILEAMETMLCDFDVPEP